MAYNLCQQNTCLNLANIGDLLEIKCRAWMMSSFIMVQENAKRSKKSSLFLYSHITLQKIRLQKGHKRN